MQTLLVILAIGTPEILLIALAILLIFGGKKIPELMRGLGKGVSEFKKGMNDLEKEIKSDVKEEPKNEEKEDKKEDKK